MNDKLKVGDKVQINGNAFDEQIEVMVDSLKIYEISEVMNTDAKGTTGQWVKIKGGIELVQHHDGGLNPHTGWLDKAWCKKV